jgi:hypothetical protein
MGYEIEVTPGAESLVSKTTTTTPSFYSVYLPDATTRYKETERIRTYVRAQKFKMQYHIEWPALLPEVVSKLDTQIALDGTSFFWGPALSLIEVVLSSLVSHSAVNFFKPQQK